jgi:pyruvate,orthophosphate dikinase
MVFGNMGDDSGTGVAFTRDPATGEKKLYGEFLINAQGEDVVAGVRTPSPSASWQETFPSRLREFEGVCNTLENHYKDMQDMEFTIERGKLYMLQTRNGKRTPQAGMKIACDLVDEGLITEKEAVLMIEPRSLDALLHPASTSRALKAAKPLAHGLPASPGAACGKIVFTAEDAKEWAKRRREGRSGPPGDLPEDIEGMKAAQGILTVRGGMTSHAAVVARGMGTCCVSGCGASTWTRSTRPVDRSGGKLFKEGDTISIDGSTGNIYAGRIPTVEADHRPASSAASWAGPTSSAPCRSAPTPTPPTTPHSAVTVRRRGHRPVPHRAYVLQRRTASPPSAR